MVWCGSDVFYRLEMLDEWERFVKSMEQLTPLPIFGRASESYGVVVKAVPFDQWQEHIWSFDIPRHVNDWKPGIRLMMAFASEYADRNSSLIQREPGAVHASTITRQI